MEFDPPLYTTRGVAYRQYGSGSPLLLLHGGSGSYTHWVRNIAAISSNRRVIAMDLPGFGDSTDVRPDISMEDYVDMVADSAIGVCGRGCDLIGFSFGGLIASGVAARSRLEPRRLSLLAPSGFGPLQRPAPGQKRGASAARDDAPARREVYRHNLRAIMVAHDSTIDDKTLNLHVANLERARFNTRNLSYSDSLIKNIKDIECPLQLVYGASDATAYPSVQTRISLCLETARPIRVDVVPNAGHWVQYECPEPTNTILRSFLNDERKTRF